MIDSKEFVLGCKRLGGIPRKHSEWDYSCEINGLSIGMSINGLLQVFDRRRGTYNDVSMNNFDRFHVDDKNKMIFGSATGKLEINPISRGIKVQTTVIPHSVDDERFELEKEAKRYQTAKIKVPDHSVIKMPAPKVGSLEWEVEELEPVLYSDGRNIVKGTKEDFLSSTHEPEYTFTKNKKPVAFRIGAELIHQKKSKDSFPDYDSPPMCIPVGNACFNREQLYGIAEEIIEKPIVDPYKGIVKEALGKTVRLEGFQSTNPDFDGVLRIVGKNGVNYVLYPISFLPEGGIKNTYDY